MRARKHKTSKYIVIMLTLLWSAALIGAAWAVASPEATAPASITKVQAVEAYGKLPLAFIENQGQVNSQVKYYTQARDHAVFFTPEGMTLGLSPSAGKGGQKGKSSSVVRLRPLGINPGVEIAATEPMEGKINYYRGNDPQKWVSNIPTYKSVVYRQAYAGIDMKFYGADRQVEYDLIVKPGADPKQVKFLYQGIKGLKVSKAGELVITLPDGGKMVQKTPVIYQDIEGQRVSRQGKFKILPGTKNRGYGFELAAYDTRYPLVIDPVTLVYSTYLGGNTFDSGNAIAVDAAGNAYVVGTTQSPNFPATVGAYVGGEDVFVTKLSSVPFSPAPILGYSTILGGTANDEGMAIALDAAGNVYITGLTFSGNFPVLPNPGAYQIGLTGTNAAFFTKLNTAGAITYSTFLGGSKDASNIAGTGSDMGKAIAVDTLGQAYIAGDTSSIDFPLSASAYQIALGAPGSTNCFVSKINPAGAGLTDLVYSTYLGGNVYDAVWGLALTPVTNVVCVTGETESSNFPHTTGALTGFSNVFFSKLDTTIAGLGGLTFGTIYGGTGFDAATGGIALDAAGNAYIAGNTDSADFLPLVPPSTPFQATLKGFNNAFVTKFNAANTMVYSTYLGGSGSDLAWYIALDTLGNVYVTGETDSADFPRSGIPFQNLMPGGSCAFVTKFNVNTALSTTVFSTFLGGNTQDFGYGLAVDPSGHPYVTGLTQSTNFPLRNFLAGQNTISPTSTGAAFVTKLTMFSLPNIINFFLLTP